MSRLVDEADQDWQALQEVLERAQRAIQRAKKLTARYGNGAQAGEDEPPQAPSDTQPGTGSGASTSLDQGQEGSQGEEQPASSPPIHNTSGQAQHTSLPCPHRSGASAGDDSPGPPGSGAGAVDEPLDMDGVARTIMASSPLLSVARRLAALQRQQSNTLHQLLGLRREQLRLRREQISALQELLSAEALVVEGTPLQMSAVQQALSLLAQSLVDVDVAADVIEAGAARDCTAQDVAAIAATVSCADARAEDISRMARQLLGVLREYPRRGDVQLTDPATAAPDGSGAQGSPTLTVVRDVTRGATEWEVQALPCSVCAEGQGPVGEPCVICLAAFAVDDALKWMPCGHSFHARCLGEWLRIKACCPLCMLPVPGTRLRLTLGIPVGPAETLPHADDAVDAPSTASG